MYVSLSWSHHTLIVDSRYYYKLSYLHASSFSSSERMVPSKFMIIFLMPPTLGKPSGEGLTRARYFLNPGFSRERSHLSHVYGKLGTSSTQKYVWEGIGEFPRGCIFLYMFILVGCKKSLWIWNVFPPQKKKKKR